MTQMGTYTSLTIGYHLVSAENLGSTQFDIAFLHLTETGGVLLSLSKAWYISRTSAITCLQIRMVLRVGHFLI